MAHSPEFQAASYPLAAYNFKVIVDGETMSFTEVSGLNREHQSLTYKHGYSYQEGEEIIKFRYDKYQRVTLKRGTVKGLSFVYDWLESKEPSTIEVTLCDHEGTPVTSWHIAKAIPLKLDAPTFSSGTNEASIESLELTVSGITIKDRS